MSEAQGSTFQVRDNRAGFLWLNNVIVDEYAATIGPSAFLVYAILTRFANNTSQSAFPSQIKVAALAGLSERAVRTALIALRDAGLVTWAQQATKTAPRHHVYTLLSPAKSSGLNPKRQNLPDQTGSPVPVQTGSQLPPNKTQGTRLIKPSAAAAAADVDPRHADVRAFIQQTQSLAIGVKAPWDGREAKVLAQLLRSNPSWSADLIKRMVWNRFRSDINKGDRAAVWIPSLSRYIIGALDRYGKLVGGHAPSNTVGGGSSGGSSDLRTGARAAMMARRAQQ